MDDRERRGRIRSSIREYYALQASPEREARRAAASAVADGAPSDASAAGSAAARPHRRGEELDMDSDGFSASTYTTKILREKSLKGLFEEDTHLRRKVRELDGELQTLVYDNYSKFIAATDTIRRMKTNVSDMDDRLQALSTNVEKIDQVSQTIRGGLEDHRAKIEEVLSVNRMLQKIRFLVALPEAMQRFHESGRYSTAAKYWAAGDAILEKYNNVAAFSTTHAECRSVAQQCYTALIHRIRSTDLEADKTDAIRSDVDALKVLRTTSIAVPDLSGDSFEEDLRHLMLGHAKETFSGRLGTIFVAVEEAQAAFRTKVESLRSGKDSAQGKIAAILSGHSIELTDVMETLREACFSLIAHRMRIREVLNEELPDDFYSAVMDDIVPVVVQVLALVSTNRATQMMASIDAIARAIGTLTPSGIEAVDPQSRIDNFVAQTLRDIKEFLLLHHSLSIEDMAGGDADPERGAKYVDQVMNAAEDLVREELKRVHAHCAVLSSGVGLDTAGLDHTATSSSSPATSLVKGTSNASSKAENSRTLLVVGAVLKLFAKIILPIVGGDATAVKTLYNATAKNVVYDTVPAFGGYCRDIIATSFDGNRWGSKKEPSDVSSFVVLLLDEWKHLEALASALFPAESRHVRISSGSVLSHGSSGGGTRVTGGKSTTSSAGPVVASYTRREHRLSLASNMDRMLSRTHSGLLHSKPSTIDSPHILECVLQYTLKAFCDVVREKMFNKCGFQQLQVDCSYILQSVKLAESEGHPLCRKEERISEAVNEVLCSVYDRSVERIAMPPANVEDMARSRLRPQRRSSIVSGEAGAPTTSLHVDPTATTSSAPHRVGSAAASSDDLVL